MLIKKNKNKYYLYLPYRCDCLQYMLYICIRNLITDTPVFINYFVCSAWMMQRKIALKRIVIRKIITCYMLLKFINPVREQPIRL